MALVIFLLSLIRIVQTTQLPGPYPPVGLVPEHLLFNTETNDAAGEYNEKPLTAFGIFPTTATNPTNPTTPIRPGRKYKRVVCPPGFTRAGDIIPGLDSAVPTAIHDVPGPTSNDPSVEHVTATDTGGGTTPDPQVAPSSTPSAIFNQFTVPGSSSTPDLNPSGEVVSAITTPGGVASPSIPIIQPFPPPASQSTPPPNPPASGPPPQAGAPSAASIPPVEHVTGTIIGGDPPVSAPSIPPGLVVAPTTTGGDTNTTPQSVPPSLHDTVTSTGPGAVSSLHVFPPPPPPPASPPVAPPISSASPSAPPASPPVSLVNSGGGQLVALGSSLPPVPPIQGQSTIVPPSSLESVLTVFDKTKPGSSGPSASSDPTVGPASLSTIIPTSAPFTLTVADTVLPTSVQDTTTSTSSPTSDPPPELHGAPTSQSIPDPPTDSLHVITTTTSAAAQIADPSHPPSPPKFFIRQAITDPDACIPIPDDDPTDGPTAGQTNPPSASTDGEPFLGSALQLPAITQNQPTPITTQITFTTSESGTLLTGVTIVTTIPGVEEIQPVPITTQLTLTTSISGTLQTVVTLVTTTPPPVPIEQPQGTTTPSLTNPTTESITYVTSISGTARTMVTVLTEEAAIGFATTTTTPFSAITILLDWPVATTTSQSGFGSSFSTYREGITFWIGILCSFIVIGVWF